MISLKNAQLTTSKSKINNINLTLVKKDVVYISSDNKPVLNSFINTLLLNKKVDGEYYFNEELVTNMNLEPYYFKLSKTSVIEEYTLYDNLRVVLMSFGYDKKTIKSKIEEILDSMKLHEYKNKPVYLLTPFIVSKLIISMAILSSKTLFVIDNLLNDLNQEETNQIIKILDKITFNKIIIIFNDNKEAYKKLITKEVVIEEDKFEVINSNKNKEKNSVMSLPEKESKKTPYTFKYILKNLISSQSSNIYSTLIYFALLCIIAVSFLAVNLNYSQKLTTSDQFNNLINNRIVIESNDQTNFNASNINKKLKTDNVVLNSFFEDVYFEFSFENEALVHNALLLTYVNYRETKIYGSQPLVDEQVILGVTKNFLRQYHSNPINKVLTIDETEYTVVGYYIVNSNKDDIFITSTTEQNTTFRNNIYTNLLNEIPITRTFTINGQVHIGNNTEVFINNSLSTNEVVLYYKDEIYKEVTDGKQVSLFIQDKYNLVLKDFKITLKETQDEEVCGQLSISQKTYLNFLNLYTFQASVYQQNPKNAIKLLNELNTKNVRVISTVNVTNNMKITYGLLVFSATVLTLGLSYLSYICIKKITKSKINNIFKKLRYHQIRKKKIVLMFLVEQAIFALVAFILVYMLLSVGVYYNIHEMFVIYERSTYLYSILFIGSLVLLNTYNTLEISKDL